MPRAEKEAKVKELAEQFSAVPAAVLAGYRGLTVQEAAELRAALDEVDTRFSVVKNTLVKRAAEQAGVAELVELIDGPTAVAFIRGDVVAAAKRIVEQARKFPVLEFRGGFAEGRILTGDDVKTLAALESREVMLAKVAGLGKMQLSRAAWMFQGLQSKFLGLMNALKDKLPGEPADTTVEPEAAAAEAEAPPQPAPEEAEAAPDTEGASEQKEGPEALQQTEPPAEGEAPPEETETEPERAEEETPEEAEPAASETADTEERTEGGA
ncbi:MAG TPA: 50S ribosomal protein L10 [Actinomycetota bacterium]|nr:50S ribosomal protein L10 [Actinomycetota bacterium]